MSIIYRYTVFCIEENAYVTTYGTSTDPVPSLCPNNHADRSINPSLTSIDEIISDSIVTATENTDGYFETTTVKMLIPAGPPGTITEHDVTWPMNIIVWNTRITPTTPMIDDIITVMASPETIVGVLTVPASISDTVLNVNSTVTDNVQRGFVITLDDTVNKDVVGRVTAIDKINGTITVQTPLSYAFSPGTPVKISIYMLKDIYITDTNIIEIGQKGFRGKQLDANVPLRVYYTNNSGTEKTIYWRPEYYNVG